MARVSNEKYEQAPGWFFQMVFNEGMALNLIGFFQIMR